VTSSSRTTGLLHAGVFIVTFEVLALAISVATVLLGEGLTVFGARSDIILGILGAALCWGLAIFLFVRAIQKQKRRSTDEQQPLKDEKKKSDGGYGSSTQEPDLEKYGRGDSNDPLIEISDSDEASAWTDLTPETAHVPQPWLIVSLTVLGSLDEVSYFPSLIVGNIFTPADLCLATFLASLIILSVLYLALTPCKPFLDFLDRIPLYCIVGFFAIVLTVEVAWEAVFD
jgi:hypothetical protein